MAACRTGCRSGQRLTVESKTELKTPDEQMVEDSHSVEEQLFLHQPPRQIATPRRILVTILLVLSLLIGVVAFLVDPVYIIVILIAIVLGVLIFLYPYFGLLAYYATLIVQPGAFVPQVAVLHPERIVGGLLMVALLIHKRFKGEKILILQERMSWLFLFFILAMCLSIPTSYWPTATFWAVIDFVKICVFYFFIINIVTSEKKLKGFLWLYVISTGYTAISSALAYFSGALMFAQGIERAEGLAGADPNTLAVTLILAIPFLIFSFGWIKNHWLRIVPLFCAACAIFTVSLTGSRSGILGLLAVMFFVWLTSKHKMVLAMLFLVVVAAGWFALPEQYKNRYSSIASTEYDESTQGRFDAWEAGIRMFYSRPFFGVGAGTFNVAYASGNFSDRISWLKAHSMYIQIIAEIGLFGLVAFSLLVYHMIRQNFLLRKVLLKHFKRRHWLSYISYSITCSVGALFITAVFGHSLFRMHWYWACALTVVMWNLADKLMREGSGDEKQSSDSGRRPLPQRS